MSRHAPIRPAVRSAARSLVRSLMVEGLESRRLFAVSYTVTDLAPDLNGVVHTGRAYGESNNGRVAMQYDGDAAVWFNGAVKDLGFAGYATDVNDNGVVCGVDSSTGVNRPFVYKEGVKTILSLDGNQHGVASAINASGTVVGTFYYDGSTVKKGFVATLNGSAHDIGAPAGVSTVYATGINDAGQIVGNLQLTNGGGRAFIKSNDAFKVIANLPGGETSRIGHGLTNTGTLAVSGPSGLIASDGTTKVYHVYTVGSNGYGTPADKGTYNQAYDIAATDINAGGTITADTNPGLQDSFALRNSGGGFDLLDNLVNAQLGWHFSSAQAVNDGGAIVGYGSNGQDGSSPYLLTPIAVATAKINGRVFNDADNDGVRDSGEGNLAGVKVTISRNGVALNTLTTGDSGEFSFTGLEAGTYVVSQMVLSGYTATAPAGGTYTVTVADGQVVGDKFFGEHKTDVPVQKYQIRGKVWNDTDNDGVFDASEVVSGVRTVFLDTNRNGVLDSGEKSTQSNANGEYGFDGLANGEYAVARVLPTGYHLSNGTNGKPYVVVNISGANVLGVNLGSAANVEPPKTATITGLVFNDTDKDGVFDDNESSSGVRTVFIDTNGNKKLDDGEKSVQSNGEGRYTFSGLAAGTYRLTRVFPSGYKLSNNNDGFVTITVSSGQVKTGVNLGSKTA